MLLEELIIVILAFSTKLTSFIAGAIGQGTLLFLSFLSGNHEFISTMDVLIFGVLGFITADLLIFAIGKTSHLQRLDNWLIMRNRQKDIFKLIDKFVLNELFIALLASRFIYGTRMATTLYMSIRDVSYKRFIIADILAVVIWAVIMIPLTVLISRGLLASFSDLQGLGSSISLAIIFIILSYIIGSFFMKKVVREHAN